MIEFTAPLRGEDTVLLEKLYIHSWYQPFPSFGQKDRLQKLRRRSFCAPLQANFTKGRLHIMGKRVNAS